MALVNDQFYVVGDGWVFQFDITTWGWVHLLLGIVIVLDVLIIWALAAHGRDITRA